MVGAVPPAYGAEGGRVSLDTYFAMAKRIQATGRGSKHRESRRSKGPRPEMRTWFATNYRYLVPEFRGGQTFSPGLANPVEEFLEAKNLGIHTRPVVIGPVTYLLLRSAGDSSFAPLEMLPRLLPVCAEVALRLEEAGADWVQIHESALSGGLDSHARRALYEAYADLTPAAPRLRLMVATCFDSLSANLDLAPELPVAGLHVDLVSATEQIYELVAKARKDFVLSLGVVDGRSVRRTDLLDLLGKLECVAREGGFWHLRVASSCSLMHVPFDLDKENKLDRILKTWLAFAIDKPGELRTIVRKPNDGRAAASDLLTASKRVEASRGRDRKSRDPAVARQMSLIVPSMAEQTSAIDRRRSAIAWRCRAFRRRFLGAPAIARGVPCT